MSKVSAALVKDLRERTGLGMMECKKALIASSGDIDAAIEELRKSSGMKAAKKASRTAAEGIILMEITADQGTLVEVNTETDFAAKDESFREFAHSILRNAHELKTSDISVVLDSNINSSREQLVQKIGENITPRRVVSVTAPVIDGYIHGNDKIGVLVCLSRGSREVARDIAMHVAAVNPTVLSSEQMPTDLIEAEKNIFTAQARESGKPEEIIEKMISGRINKFLKENSLLDQAFVKDPDVTIRKFLENNDSEITSYHRFEVGEGIEIDRTDFASEAAAQIQSIDK